MHGRRDLVRATKAGRTTICRAAFGTTVAAGLLFACASPGSTLPPFDGALPLGTWGGDSAGLIVSDTAAHVHIGCTYGDISGRVAVGSNGQFDVAGSYMLRAYPVTVGPSVPARFVGRLDGAAVTVSVTVDDTVQHTTVVRGPVTVEFGVDPRLGPCPICRRPIVTKHDTRFSALRTLWKDEWLLPPTQ